MIKVEAKVPVFKEHGNESAYGKKELMIKSAWRDNHRIVLVYEGMEIEVSASDLHAAINAATTVGSLFS